MASAWSQSDLDAIEAAIKSGVQRVKYDNKEIEYRSMDEMMRVRDAIRKTLGQTAASPRILANFSKGL